MMSVSSSVHPVACLSTPALSSDTLLATQRGSNEDLVLAAANEPHHPCIVAVHDEFEGGDPESDIPAPTAELIIAVAPHAADTAGDTPAISKWITGLLRRLLFSAAIYTIVIVISPLPIILTALLRARDVRAFALVLLAVFLCYGLRDESDDRPLSVPRQLRNVLGETVRTRS